MKKLRIILSLLIVVSGTLAQTNLLQNPGFENGTSNPDGYSQFSKVNNWKNRFSGTNCGGEPWHSPDWFKTGSFLHEGLPHSGYGHAGFTNYELMQQKLNNNLIAGKEYTVRMWIKLSTNFPANAPTFWNNSALKVYLATGTMEYKQEEGNCTVETINAFCESDYKTLEGALDIKEYTVVSNFTSYIVGGDWNLVYITITAPGKFLGLFNYEWFGIQMTQNSGCRDAYLLIDDVELYQGKPCCPDHQIYTNTSSLPSITQVSNYIEAGENLGSY